MTVLAALTATGGGLIVLIDPGRTTPAGAARLARRAADEGASAILLGNSFGDPAAVDALAASVRAAAPELVRLQFPATAAQLTPRVDAVLFLSLVTGRNPQYLIEEHVRAVPFFARHPEVEAISTAYCLVDGGCITSVESVSQTRPLPAGKPELLGAHLRAAMMIGMRAAYVDAGSGATRAVSPPLVRAAREATEGPLFVGGGVRSPAAVRAARDAGADFVVVGTLLEESGARAVRALAHAARA